MASERESALGGAEMVGEWSVGCLEGGRRDRRFPSVRPTVRPSVPIQSTMTCNNAYQGVWGVEVALLFAGRRRLVQLLQTLFRELGADLGDCLANERTNERGSRVSQ